MEPLQSRYCSLADTLILLVGGMGLLLGYWFHMPLQAATHEANKPLKNAKRRKIRQFAAVVSFLGPTCWSSHQTCQSRTNAKSAELLYFYAWHANDKGE